MIIYDDDEKIIKGQKNVKYHLILSSIMFLPDYSELPLLQPSSKEVEAFDNFDSNDEEKNNESIHIMMNPVMFFIFSLRVI